MLGHVALVGVPRICAHDDEWTLERRADLPDNVELLNVGGAWEQRPARGELGQNAPHTPRVIRT
jgi:hypothetical protein